MNWPCDDMEPPPKDKRWMRNGPGPRPDPPKLTFFAAWVVMLAIFVSIVWSFVYVAKSLGAEPSSRYQEHGQGEPLGTHKKWGLHPSLGVVFHYRVEGQDVFYAHAIKAHGPVGECTEIMGKVENCKAFSIRGGAIMLMTMENETPYLYLVDILPSAKRINGGEYQRILGVTFKRECE